MWDLGSTVSPRVPSLWGNEAAGGRRLLWVGWPACLQSLPGAGGGGHTSRYRILWCGSGHCSWTHSSILCLKIPNSSANCGLVFSFCLTGQPNAVISN